MPTIDKPLQFGIRHLLGVMFVVSLVAALIAPWVRGWSAGQWLVLGTQTAVVAGTFLLYVGSSFWMRRIILRQLGAERFRVKCQTWGQGAWRPRNAYNMLAFASFMLILFTAATIASGARDVSPGLQGFYAGIFAGMGVTQLLSPPDVMVIGERGLMMEGWRFVPWKGLRYAFQPEHRPVSFFLKSTIWAFELTVPEELEQPLDEFLRVRAEPWTNPPARRKVKNS
jgi:hypothetical protein